MMQTRIDCRVGFECCAQEKDHHRVGGRSSESSDDSSSNHMESPIKKMLLNELIKEHEKELLLGGNLVPETTLNNNTNNARKKKKIYENETEEETEDAIARSNSSTDACFAHALFHHNALSSEPIPIPVADLQLRYETQRALRAFLRQNVSLFAGKKVVLLAKVDLLSHTNQVRYFRVAKERERFLVSKTNLFLRKTLSLELAYLAVFFSRKHQN